MWVWFYRKEGASAAALVTAEQGQVLLDGVVCVLSEARPTEIVHGSASTRELTPSSRDRTIIWVR